MEGDSNFLSLEKKKKGRGAPSNRGGRGPLSKFQPWEKRSLFTLAATKKGEGEVPRKEDIIAGGGELSQRLNLLRAKKKKGRTEIEKLEKGKRERLSRSSGKASLVR